MSLYYMSVGEERLLKYMTINKWAWWEIDSRRNRDRELPVDLFERAANHPHGHEFEESVANVERQVKHDIPEMEQRPKTNDDA